MKLEQVFFWRKRLNRRLILAFVMAIIPPIVVLVTVSTINTGRIFSREIEARQQDTTQIAAREVATFIDATREDLEEVGQFWFDYHLAPQQLNGLLQETSTEKTIFQSLWVMDATGQEIARVEHGAPVPGDWLENRREVEYFFRAERLGYGRAYYSLVRFEEGQPQITLSVPVLDNGSVVGVVAANIDLSQSWASIRDLKIGDKGYAYLIDSSGTLLVTQDANRIGQQLDFVKLQPVRDALAGKQSVDRYDSPISGQVLGSAHQIKGPNWILVAERPISEAFAASGQMQLLSALIALLAALIALLLGYFLSRSITRSITDLTQKARQAEKGDLSARTNVKRQDEIGELGHAFNTLVSQLQELISSLEQRVANRTQDLFLTVEVGQLASRIYLQEELLPRVTEFIRDRFSLYYTQVFLLDDVKQYAVLHAGTGEVGQQLMKFGHKLALGQTSIVARAVQMGRPVLVADTTASKVHMPNPLLPDTRSEVAIPLVVGDQIIGVLDMQAAQAETFNEDNLPVFQAMANQLAAALRSSQAYAEATHAAERADMVTQRLLREGWQSYLGRAGQGECISYQYDLTRVEERQPQAANGNQLITQPISLHGQSIGAIQFPELSDRKLTPEELQLVEDVADRVALAVEQFRAFDETQYSLQQTQTLYNASRMLIAAATPDDLLNVAAAPALKSSPCDATLFYVFTDNTGKPEAVEVAAHTQSVEMPFIPVGARLSLAESPLGSLLTADVHQIQVISDTRNPEHPLVDERGLRLFQDRGVGAMAIIPVSFRDSWIGMLALSWTEPHVLSQDEQLLYNVLGPQLGALIENRRLFTEAQRFAAELQTVAQVGAQVTTILDVDQLLQTVANLVKDQFHLYHAHVYLLDPAGEYLLLAAGAGEAGRQMVASGHRISASHERSLVARAARERQSVIVNDVRAVPDFLPNPLLPQTRSEMAIPLLVGNTVIGVADVQAAEVDRFSEEDARVLGTLASQIAVAVQNARLFSESSQRLSIIENSDSLIALTNIEGKVLYMNPAGLRMLGCESVTDVINRDMAEWYAPEDMEVLLRDGFPQALQVGIWRGESRIRGGDDRLIPIEESIFVLTDENNQPEAAAIMATDITARKRAEAEIRRRAIQLQAVAEVGAQVTTILDADELLWTVANLAKDRFDVYHAHIYLLDETGDDLVLAAGAGEAGQQMVAAGHRISASHERSLVARAARERQSVSVSNVRNVPDFLPNPLLPLTRSELAIPMVVGEQVIGVLDVQASQADRFSEEDARVLETLTAQIAIAVQNARSFASEREERELSDALRATAAAISGTLKFEEVLEQILRYARRVVPHDASDIMLIDGSMARIVRSWGYPEDLAESVLALRFDISQIPHMQEIIRTRQPFIISDTALYPGWIVSPESAWIRSHIVAPIQAEGEVIGFLDLDSATPGAFTPDSAARLQAFADQAAAAISNARAYAQVQETERALEGQFAFLQNLIDNIPNPVFYKSTNGAYLGCNRSFSEFVGLPTRDIIGKTANEIFPLEQAEVYNQKDIELFREPALQVYEASISFADGSLRDVVFNRAPFLDASGEVAGLVGVMLDVTDRNRAEAEIRRRAVELRTVAEVGAQVTTILEVDQLLWTVSNLVTERFGLYHAHVYLLDQASENLVLAAGAGEAGRQMVAAGHRIAASHERSLVARAFRDRHSVSVNNVRSVPDFLPNPLLPQTQSELAIPLMAGEQMLGVLDVQASEKGRFSEEDARVLGTLAAQIAVSVQNAQLFSEVQIEAERRAWLYELGQRLSESLEPEAIATAAASGVSMLLDVPEVAIFRFDRNSDMLSRIGATGPVSEQAEGLVMPVDASPEAARVVRDRIVLAEPDVFSSADGGYDLAKQLGFTSSLMVPILVADTVLGLFILSDTRGPRVFEEGDVRLAQSVSFQVGAALQNAYMFIEQVEMTQQLREVDRLKSEFLASMSHELRTPLNSIIGYAEVLLDGIDGDLTDEMQEDVVAIHGSGKHLLNLINDILDLAKIEAGQMDMITEPVDLRSFVHELTTTSRVLLKGKEVELVVDVPEGTPKVQADPLRLRQVISNLLTNAIKFTQEGSITVQVRPYDENPAMLAVAVIDTGIGIKQEHLPLIFERFRQVDQSATRRVGGTGLGLAITRQLVQMHNGDIWVESEVGVGSSFIFTIPAATEE